MRVYPVTFVWKKLDVVDADGALRRVMAMVPLPKYGNLAGRQFVEGEDYTLTPLEERSMASHKQFFAALKSGYDNLPEKVFYRTDAAGKFVLDEFKNRVPKWPTPTHYRKWLLIEAGWFTEKVFEEATPAHAKRLAVWIRSDVGEEAEYWRIKITGCVVTIRVAKSQALPAMKNEDFKQSKKDVLELNDALTGVESGTHWREAAMHA
jgi:hypothetical protein